MFLVKKNLVAMCAGAREREDVEENWRQHVQSLMTTSNQAQHSVHPPPSHPLPTPSSVADPDPGSGAFLTPESGMNNPDHISKSLETIFWVKILQCGSGIRDEKNRIRDKHPGSATLTPTKNLTVLLS